LNHEKFRDKLSGNKEDIQARERMRMMRERNKIVTLRDPVSVSVSVSAPKEGDKKGGNEDVALPFESTRFKEAWEDWSEHRRKIKKPMTPKAESLNLKKLPNDEAEAILWIENAIANCWQGLYEPANKQTRGNYSQTKPPVLQGWERQNMTQAQIDAWHSERRITDPVKTVAR